MAKAWPAAASDDQEHRCVGWVEHSDTQGQAIGIAQLNPAYGLHQGAGEGLHHFVVHGAAVQGMGVGHHGDPFGAARWAVAHRLHRANHAIEGDFFGLRDHLHGLAAQVLRDAQAFHDAAIFEVGFNNLVDVRFIDKAVPHAFGIDHADRGGRAAV